LEPLTDIGALEKRVNALTAGEFSEKQREAINQFQKSVKRRKQGKPDRDFLDDDDDD
jgi:hypothetical protein